MLIPGTIPKKEPMIRVGIILPQDNIKETSIKLSDVESYEMETDNDHFPSCKNHKEIFIILKNNKIFIPDLALETSVVNFAPHLPDELPNIALSNIVAGRGFHWEKNIEVKFWGKIEFSILDDKLMVINELPLERYLDCVSTSEMSSKCPPEFLKTQAIVARSWLLANIEQKHRDLGFDICNDDCCQRYQGINDCNDYTISHTSDTYGKVLTFEGHICDTRYSKSCGGITEKYENVWGGEPIPYLTSIRDTDHKGIPYCNPQHIPEKSVKKYIGSVDENIEYFRWNYIVSQKDLIQSINNKFEIELIKVLELNPLRKGESGRIIELGIDYLNMKNENKTLIINSEYEIRNILSESFLFSSAFNISKQNENFLLEGKGWGHGVGLCQIGALGMALSKYKVDKILSHYYPKSILKSIY